MASAISRKNRSPYTFEHRRRLLSYIDFWNLCRFSLDMAGRVYLPGLLMGLAAEVVICLTGLSALAPPLFFLFGVH